MQRFIMGSGACVGVQWDITPKIKCSDFITCVKEKRFNMVMLLISIISIGDPIVILLLGGS